MVEIAFPKTDNLWPRVVHLQQTTGQVAMELVIPPSLVWFDGHFPGHPILPGVVQVYWAEHIVRQLCREFSATYQLKNLKFNRMVLPGANLCFSAAVDNDNQRIKFTYQQDQQTCSSGVFVGQ